MKKMRKGTIGKFFKRGSVIALVLLCFLLTAMPAMAAGTEPIEEIAIEETSRSTWAKPDFTVYAVGMKVYERNERYDQEKDKYDWEIKVGAKNGYRFDNNTTYLYVDRGDLYAHFKRISDTEAIIYVSTSPLVIDVYPNNQSDNSTSYYLPIPQVSPKPPEENGFIKTERYGWQRVNGFWYYTDGINHKTGWQQLDGNWYYFADDGIMQVGWRYIGSRWYYFSNEGSMKKGWQKIGDKWYFFVENPITVKTHQYCTDNTVITTEIYMPEGAMVFNTWVHHNDHYFYMKADGTMAANEWIGRYHFNEEGQYDKYQ